jgi:hypothetical protein
MMAILFGVSHLGETHEAKVVPQRVFLPNTGIFESDLYRNQVISVMRKE